MNTANLNQEIFLNEGNKNVLYSPLSLQIACLVLLEQLEDEHPSSQGLECFLEGQSFGTEQYLSLIEDLKQKNLDVELETANAAWYAPILGELKSELPEVDFFKQNLKKVGLLKQKANQWVRQKTKGLIKKAPIKIEDDPSLLRMVLLNSLYFKAKWIQEYAPVRYGWWFYPDQGEKYKVGYLGGHTYNATHLKYLNQPDFHAISIDYKNPQFRFEVYLPHQKNGLKELIKNLDQVNFQELGTEFHSVEECNYFFPKFQFDFELSLTDYLSKFEIPYLFEMNEANPTIGSNREAVFVKKILQKNCIAVHEKGTEAATVTSIGMVASGASSSQPKIEFHATHPFLFAIRDVKNELILYMGKVGQPDRFKLKASWWKKMI